MNLPPGYRRSFEAEGAISSMRNDAAWGWLISLGLSLLAAVMGGVLYVLGGDVDAWREELPQCMVYGLLFGAGWLIVAVPWGRTIRADCRAQMTYTLTEGGLLLDILADDAYERYPALGRTRDPYWQFQYRHGGFLDLLMFFTWQRHRESFRLRLQDLLYAYPSICRQRRDLVVLLRWRFAYLWVFAPLLLSIGLVLLAAYLQGDALTGKIDLTDSPFRQFFAVPILFTVACSMLLDRLPIDALRLALCDTLEGHFAEDAGEADEDLGQTETEVYRAPVQEEAAWDAQVRTKRKQGDSADEPYDGGWG